MSESQHPGRERCTPGPTVADYGEARGRAVSVARPSGQVAMPDLLPSFSIVTPSLDQFEFLRVCVASVEAQGYPKVEQIVIDGGSTDGTREFLARDPWPVSYWQSEPDRGQSHALNIALSHAVGEWIGWQNADDLYLPGALWRVARTIAGHPGTDVVVGDTLLVDERGLPLGTIGVCPVPARRWLEGFWPYNQSVFFRRLLLERVGLADESLRLHMDTDLLARVAQMAPPVAYIQAALGAYRKHSGAKTIAGALDPASLSEREILERRYGRKLWPDGAAARLLHRLRLHLIRVRAFGPGSLVERFAQRAARSPRAVVVAP